MTTATGGTEVWQARIKHAMAAQLREDAKLLGLEGQTDILKEALRRLHQDAEEERMARSVSDFYGGKTAPLPIGVRPGRTSA